MIYLAIHHFQSNVMSPIFQAGGTNDNWTELSDLFKCHCAAKHSIRGVLISRSTEWPSRSRTFIFSRVQEYRQDAMNGQTETQLTIFLEQCPPFSKLVGQMSPSVKTRSENMRLLFNHRCIMGHDQRLELSVFIAGSTTMMWGKMCYDCSKFHLFLL